MLQSFLQELHVFDASAMDLRAQQNHLLIPRLNKIRESIAAQSPVPGLRQQTLFLLDDSVVVVESLNVRRVKRNYTAIEETASRIRTAADYFQFVSSEPDRVQLGEVARQRFALAVNERLFGVSLNADLQIAIDRIAAVRGPADQSSRLTKCDRFIKMMGSKRFCVGEDLDSFQPVCLALSVVAVQDVKTAGPINFTC